MCTRLQVEDEIWDKKEAEERVEVARKTAEQVAALRKQFVQVPRRARI